MTWSIGSFWCGGVQLRSMMPSRRKKGAVLSLHFLRMMFSDGSADWASLSWAGPPSRGTGCPHTVAYLRRSILFWWRDCRFLSDTSMKRSSARSGRSVMEWAKDCVSGVGPCDILPGICIGSASSRTIQGLTKVG